MELIRTSSPLSILGSKQFFNLILVAVKETVTVRVGSVECVNLLRFDFPE